MPGDLRWDVAAAPDQPAGVTAELVVCTASASRTAVRQWPTASVIALVDARDDGRGVLGALDAGAAACVRGDDLGVVAAFVRSVARRRPALDKDASA